MQERPKVKSVLTRQSNVRATMPRTRDDLSDDEIDALLNALNSVETRGKATMELYKAGIYSSREFLGKLLEFTEILENSDIDGRDIAEMQFDVTLILEAVEDLLEEDVGNHIPLLGKALNSELLRDWPEYTIHETILRGFNEIDVRQVLDPVVKFICGLKWTAEDVIRPEDMYIMHTSLEALDLATRIAHRYNYSELGERLRYFLEARDVWHPFILGNRIGDWALDRLVEIEGIGCIEDLIPRVYGQAESSLGPELDGLVCSKVVDFGVEAIPWLLPHIDSYLWSHAMAVFDGLSSSVDLSEVFYEHLTKNLGSLKSVQLTTIKDMVELSSRTSTQRAAYILFMFLSSEHLYDEKDIAYVDFKVQDKDLISALMIENDAVLRGATRFMLYYPERGTVKSSLTAVALCFSPESGRTWTTSSKTAVGNISTMIYEKGSEGLSEVVTALSSSHWETRAAAILVLATVWVMDGGEDQLRGLGVQDLLLSFFRNLGFSKGWPYLIPDQWVTMAESMAKDMK